MLIEPQKVIDVIRHVAKTEVMPRFRNLQEGDIREKNPGDFVTIADEESEKAFTLLLAELLPNSLIVGEEAVAKDVTVLNKLSEAEPVWLIDPIDGTYNYKTGSEEFGILISLVHGGETVMGFFYDAPNDECFYTVKGKGAFREGGEQITISNQELTDIEQMRCLVGRTQLEKLKSHFPKIANIRCSLHMVLHFLKGQTDFVLWHSVTPWDNAGCALLVQELYGYVGYIDGTKYSPMNKPQNKFLLAATSEEQWKTVSEVINSSGLRNVAA